MRGRVARRVYEIVDLEIQTTNAWIEKTGDVPEAGAMSMVSAIASSLETDDIEDTLDLIYGLQDLLRTEQLQEINDYIDHHHNPTEPHELDDATPGLDT